MAPMTEPTIIAVLLFTPDSGAVWAPEVGLGTADSDCRTADELRGGSVTRLVTGGCVVVAGGGGTGGSLVVTGGSGGWIVGEGPGGFTLVTFWASAADDRKRSVAASFSRCI